MSSLPPSKTSMKRSSGASGSPILLTRCIGIPTQSTPNPCTDSLISCLQGVHKRPEAIAVGHPAGCLGMTLCTGLCTHCTASSARGLPAVCRAATSAQRCDNSARVKAPIMLMSVSGAVGAGLAEAASSCRWLQMGHSASWVRGHNALRAALIRHQSLQVRTCDVA